MLVIRSLILGLVVTSLSCSKPREFGKGLTSQGGAGGQTTAAGGSRPDASLAGAESMGGADGTPPDSSRCGEDEYEDGSVCRPLTTCAADECEAAPPKRDRDRVCAKGAECDRVEEPECSTASDRECTAECPCASGEGVCSASDQCVSGASCVPGSGNKVGRSEDTCLAAHCDNDKLDADETSVDCGGECGCRATMELVTLKNIPAGATFSNFEAMSRDGTRLGATLARGRTSYPAAVASDGTVTELQAYGKGGSVFAASGDGSVLVGGISCADPPACANPSQTLVTWSGSAAPTLLVSTLGTARGTSSSGTIIAGDFYDSSASEQRGFIYNGSQWVAIPELSSASGITPDGKYVAGQLQVIAEAGLWYAPTKTITKIGASDWSTTTLAGVNGTNPAVIGYGYISASDTYVGFRWKGGMLTELGLLEGAKFTSPTAISADGGTAVGSSGSNDFQQAFVWTEKDKLRSLMDELKARGLEPAPDLALSARFISDDGKTIVGGVASPPSFWRIILQ